MTVIRNDILRNDGFQTLLPKQTTLLLCALVSASCSRCWSLPESCQEEESWKPENLAPLGKNVDPVRRRAVSVTADMVTRPLLSVDSEQLFRAGLGNNFPDQNNAVCDEWIPYKAHQNSAHTNTTFHHTPTTLRCTCITPEDDPSTAAPAEASAAWGTCRPAAWAAAQRSRTAQ